ncbi:histone-lysine N-methyltransferase SETMAR [Elysia marginata]|uniref:Histone-lysine N-methyltransferase SETMAR n=1 Tax=Elysia marginata TaxID=1093978 RepID=A0AAV4I9D0_9GAST|nr:histone-lysine N-methyltransferase SETMAR [Elysia marginata]
MEEEDAGAVGRRRVYGRLYAVWRAATGGKGRVVWPLELREAVRETVKEEESEGGAGKYDSQHDCNQSTILKMAAHLETGSKEEIRAVIRFLNAKSLNPTEIHKELQSVYGEHVISRTQVYHWSNLLEAGHSDLTDREGRGRLITATSEDNVKRVDELIRQDRRLKLHEIARGLEISETSAHRIVFDELGYRKVSARWVPKQLTDNHREQRLDICRELLRRSESSRRVHGRTANAGGDFSMLVIWIELAPDAIVLMVYIGGVIVSPLTYGYV